MNRRLCTVFITALLTLSPAHVLADGIYTYLDENGKRVFTNVAPGGVQSPADQKALLPRVSNLRKVRSGILTSDLESSEVLRSKIAALVAKYDFAKFNLGPEFIHALIKVESGYNPNVVSRKGAMGLMQLMPETAKRFGVRHIFDPEENLEGGIQFLKFLLETFQGDVNLTLAAYNAGENVVQRLKAIPPYRETQDYVRKISQILGTSRSVPIYDYANQRVTYVAWVGGKLKFTNVDPPVSAVVFDGYHLPRTSGTP